MHERIQRCTHVLEKTLLSWNEIGLSEGYSCLHCAVYRVMQESKEL